MSKPIKSVLIVEDQIHTAQRLRHAVESSEHLRVCGVSHMLDGAMQMFYAHKPDFLLTDLGLPDGSGIELIRAARAADWHCDSMVVSVFGDERRVIEAIRAGAKGYILKTSSLNDIASSILSVIDGGSPMTPQIARYLLSLVTAAPTADPAIPAIELTTRELEVLAVVAKGYKRHEIAEQLAISVGTVGNHINSIYRKMEVSSNIEAVLRATRMGLL